MRYLYLVLECTEILSITWAFLDPLPTRLPHICSDVQVSIYLIGHLADYVLFHLEDFTLNLLVGGLVLPPQRSPPIIDEAPQLRVET